MSDIRLETERDLHNFAIGYNKGFDFARGLVLGEADVAEVGPTTAAPSSPRIDSPSGPSPEGAPPHGSIDVEAQSSPATRESESDFSWGWEQLGLFDTAENTQSYIKNGEFTEAPSGFEGWGTTPEGEDLNKVAYDPLDDPDVDTPSYTVGYADGFVDGLKMAIEVANAHDDPIYDHLVQDLRRTQQTFLKMMSEAPLD